MATCMLMRLGDTLVAILHWKKEAGEGHHLAVVGDVEVVEGGLARSCDATTVAVVG